MKCRFLFLLPIIVTSLSSCESVKGKKLSAEEAVSFLNEHKPVQKEFTYVNGKGEEIPDSYFDMASLGMKGGFTCKSCGFRYQDIFHEADNEKTINFNFNNNTAHFVNTWLNKQESTYTRYKFSDSNQPEGQSFVSKTNSSKPSSIGNPLILNAKNSVDVVSYAISNNFSGELINGGFLRESLLSYLDKVNSYKSTYNYSFYLKDNSLHAKQYRYVYASNKGVINIAGMKANDSDIKVAINLEYVVNSSGLITYGKFYYTANGNDYVATEYKIIGYNDYLTSFVDSNLDK